MRFLLTAILLVAGPALGATKNCGTEIPPAGTCDGNHVLWCEDSEVHSLECKPGAMCAWNDKISAFDCLEVAQQCSYPLNGDSAASVPVNGICDKANNRVVWCDSGQVKTLECKPGTSCGWNEQIEMMDCGKDTCADVPEAGVCEANVLRWCHDGKIESVTCTEDQVCAFSNDDGRWLCLKPEEPEDQPADDKTQPKDDPETKIAPHTYKPDPGATDESGTKEPGKRTGTVGCTAGGSYPQHHSSLGFILFVVALAWARFRVLPKRSAR